MLLIHSVIWQQKRMFSDESGAGGCGQNAFWGDTKDEGEADMPDDRRMETDSIFPAEKMTSVHGCVQNIVKKIHLTFFLFKVWLFSQKLILKSDTEKPELQMEDLEKQPVK